MTLAKVLIGVYVLSTGNLLLLGLAGFYYMRSRAVPPSAAPPTSAAASK